MKPREIDIRTGAGRPKMAVHRYSTAEKIADGLIHILGLALAVGGGIVLLALSSRLDNWSAISSTSIYTATLVITLAFSAAYNMWPASGIKSMLRRCDQAAIFLLIGGTYTVFLAHVAGNVTAPFALAAIWTAAVLGMLLKLAFPGRFERLSVAAYLALGWSGLALIPTAINVLPETALRLIVLGGLLYSIGVIFHLWDRLRFQNAIWHTFVLAAAGCHYGAAVDCLLSMRT
jgi:hemolysin III